VASGDGTGMAGQSAGGRDGGADAVTLRESHRGEFPGLSRARALGRSMVFSGLGNSRGKITGCEERRRQVEAGSRPG
jgi:hypothetical protein